MRLPWIFGATKQILAKIVVTLHPEKFLDNAED